MEKDKLNKSDWVSDEFDKLINQIEDRKKDMKVYGSIESVLNIKPCNFTKEKREKYEKAVSKALKMNSGRMILSVNIQEEHEAIEEDDFLG